MLLHLYRRFSLYLVPWFFKGSSLVRAVRRRVVVLFRRPMVVSNTVRLLHPTSTVNSFPTMCQVFRGPTSRHYVRWKVFSILPLGFIGPINYGMFYGAVYTNVHVRVLIGGRTSYRYFFLISRGLPLFRLMTVEHGTTIPFSFANFLSSTFRYLRASVFALGFDRDQGGKGRRLSHVLKKVGPILRTGRVSTGVLRSLWNERSVYHVSTRA